MTERFRQQHMPIELGCFAFMVLCTIFLWIMGILLVKAGREGRLLKGCRSLQGERYWGAWVIAAAVLFTLTLPFVYQGITSFYG